MPSFYKLLPVLLLSACCKTVTIPVTNTIPVLPLPELPPLSSEQKHAIMLPTFLILVEREEKLKAHIHRQKELIRINNAN